MRMRTSEFDALIQRSLRDLKGDEFFLSGLLWKELSR